MRRPLLLFFTVALIVIGGLFAPRAAALLAFAPFSSSNETDAENAALVARFYAEVNAALRTGDPTPLDHLVASDFVEHTPLLGLPPTRLGLTRHLLTLHTTFPTVQLDVADLIALGDRVTARVRLTGADQGAFLGIPVPAAWAVWGPLDVFRVMDGRIVEHWGSRDAAVHLQELFQAELTGPLTKSATLRVERLTFLPGTIGPAADPLTRRWLLLEEGLLSVRVEGWAQAARALPDGTLGPAESVPTGTAQTLRPGDLLILPGGTSATTVADAAHSAIALAITFDERPGVLRLTFWGDGVLSRHLARQVVTDVPTAAVALVAGQITVGPGTVLPWHTATGPELLMVETGHLAVTETSDTIIRGAGDWMLVTAGERRTLRNAGETDLTVTLVTFGLANVPLSW